MGRARSVAVASCIMVRQMDVKDRIVQADADTLRYLDEANEQEQRGHALVLEAQALRAKALHEQARPSVILSALYAPGPICLMKLNCTPGLPLPYKLVAAARTDSALV